MKRLTFLVCFLMAFGVGCASSQEGADQNDQTYGAGDMTQGEEMAEDDFAVVFADRGVIDTWDLDGNDEINDDEFTEAVFGMWDQDNDGMLTEEEWHQNAGNWYPDEQVNAFDEWDTDSDNMVTMVEFSEQFRLYEAWDANDNGILDETELASGFFGMLDSDDDGVLNKNEQEAETSMWDAL